MEGQYEVLAQRPDIEQAAERYEEMQVRMRNRISEEFGLAPWTTVLEGAAAGCGREFPDINERGQTWNSPIWQVEGNLPDSQWKRALDVVAEVGAEYGFGEPVTLMDRPGKHDSFASDQYGARYFFGTETNTVLNVFSGCHLTAEAHPGDGSAE